MNINEDEAKVLQILYKSYGKSDIFTIFKKFKQPLFQLNKIVMQLEQNSYVTVDKSAIFITEIGKLLINSTDIKKMLNKDTSWKEIPKDFLDNKIDINDFYIPNYNLFKKKVVK